MNHIELVKQRLEPINLMLPASLPTARDRAMEAMGKLGATREEYKKLYADSFNCGLRQLIREDPIDGWHIVDGGNCLHLRDAETHLKLRFLKEFAFTGALPPAGHNRNRIEAWCQDSLDIFDMEAPQSGKPLEGVELIVVWTEHPNRFSCTAWQPLTAGRFPIGAKGKAIMTMPLGVDAQAFERMSFNGDEREDLMVPKRNEIVRQRTTAEAR